MGKLIFLLSAILLSFLEVSALEVTDIFGRKVDVPDRVERVAALGSSMSFLNYLQSMELAVGAEDIEQSERLSKPYIYAHKEFLKSLPTIGKGGPVRIPSYENIIKLNPDVVFIVATDVNQPDMIQSKLRIPVVTLGYGRNTYEPSEFYKSLEIAGRTLKKEKRAAELISYAENLSAELVPNPAEPVSGYIAGISYKGNQGFVSTSADFLPFEMAGIKNASALSGRSGQIFLTKEYVLAKNPPLIFIDGSGFSIIKDEAVRQPGYFERLAAFRNNNAYLVLPDTSYFVNPEVMLANSFMMAKAAYPEKYIDLDPVEKADEIFKMFNGVPLYSRYKKDTGGYKMIKLSNSRFITEELRSN